MHKNQNIININIKLIILIPILCLSLLVACEDSRNLFASEDIVDEGWAAKTKEYKPKKTYCYKTLAGIDCYDNPQKGEDIRLVEKYDDSNHDDGNNEEGKRS